MRVSCARSAIRDGSRNHKPAMPHMRKPSRVGAGGAAIPVDGKTRIAMVACELVVLEKDVVQGIDVNDAQLAGAACAGGKHAIARLREERGIEGIVEEHGEVALG